MTITVTQLVSRSLNLLGIYDPGDGLKSIDATTAILALNQMMARVEEDGIAVGWSPVVTVADTVPAPDAALEAIAANLAMKLAPEYRTPMRPELVEMATSGMDAMRRDAIKNTLSATDLRFLPGTRDTFNIISG